MSIVLFGSGGMMIVEVEETCARLGLDIVAIVKNADSPDYTLGRERIVLVNDITPEMTPCRYIVPIFTPGHRLAASREAAARGFVALTTLIDPTAVVARSTTLGSGTYVNASAVIGGSTRIGGSVFINRCANIGHHAELADFVSIGPGATIAGAGRVGRGTVIGAGATVLPAVKIGSNSAVAAGSVVTRPVGDHCLVAGNPARVVRADYAGFRNLSV